MGKLGKFLATVTGKIIAAAVVIIVVLGFLQFRSCQQGPQKAAESRLQRGQTEALSNSAKDAIATQGAAAGRETASEELTRTNEREIRDAEGASDAVNPAVRDAGFASLCRRPSFRNSPTGRLRCAPPAGMEKGR